MYWWPVDHCNISGESDSNVRLVWDNQEFHISFPTYYNYFSHDQVSHILHKLFYLYFLMLQIFFYGVGNNPQTWLECFLLSQNLQGLHPLKVDFFLYFVPPGVPELEVELEPLGVVLVPLCGLVTLFIAEVLLELLFFLVLSVLFWPLLLRVLITKITLSLYLF